MQKKQIEIPKKSGFTLIEILVVIGLIAILATIVIIAINPARQFAQGRNTQRTANVNALLNAVGQNIADNKGSFVCAAGVLPSTAALIEKTGGYDLRPCIAPTYIPEIVLDPGAQDSATYPGGTNTCTDTAGKKDCTAGSYNTQYTISQDSTGRVTVCAPWAAHETALTSPTEICVTR